MMLARALRLADSALVRNSFTLFSGSLLTQAVIFLCSPLLSRIFQAADFGNLANFNAWVAILALLSCLRYEHAIIVAPDQRTTLRVFALTGVLCLVSVVAYAVLAVAMFEWAPDRGYIGHLRDIALLIPVGILAICVTSPLTQLNVKAGRFRRLAAAGVGQALVTIGAQVGLGVAGLAHGLIVGTIVGYAFAGAVLAGTTWRDGLLDGLVRQATRRRLFGTARRFRNFPRYTLPADAVGVVSQQFGPVIMLALFGPVSAGIYSFALRIVRAPLLLVSASLSTALRREALDHLERPGGLHALLRHTMGLLLAIAVLPFILLTLFGPDLFEFVFGAEWREAGRVVRILGPGILLEFLAIPLAVFFLITETQRFSLVTQGIGFILVAAAMWTGRYWFGSFTATCVLVSVAMVVANLLTVIVAGRVTRARSSDSGGVRHADPVPEATTIEA